MKKLVTFAQVVALGLFVAACGPQGGGDSESDDKKDKKEQKGKKADKKDYTINLDESAVNWSGTLVGVYTHRGSVEFKEGKFTAVGNELKKGTFEVDLTSITPTDDNYEPDEEGKTKDDLVEHLKNDDFFHVKDHPTAKFEVIEHNVEANTLKGKMTIRGKTHEEVVEEFMFNPETGQARGNLKVKRKKYDVAFTHPLEDMTVSNEMEMEIHFKAAS